MFKKSQRFSFRTGVPKNKIVTPLFILKFAKTNTAQYAVVTSKSVSKKAVHRNKVKRLFTEIIRELFEKNEKTYTLVFFLRSPYTQYTKSAIITELKNLLARIEASS